MPNAARVARDVLQNVTIDNLLRADAAGMPPMKARTIPRAESVPGYSAADLEPVGEAPIGTLGGNGRTAI